MTIYSEIDLPRGARVELDLYDYLVVYDEPDEHGYWGRRLTALYFGPGKAAHDAVETRFRREHPTAKIYRVTCD